MKRALVLLGEGHGETSALPVLVRRLLKEKDADDLLYADADVIRSKGVTGLVKWDNQNNRPDYGPWLHYIDYASRRRNLGGVLAILDGDAKNFPAATPAPFCAATAARDLAKAAANQGAGKTFSLALVFACLEYESWLIAGAESLRGRRLRDGRVVLPPGLQLPASDFEKRGKGWLEKNCSGYRPTRDQADLAELVDLSEIRRKQLRSFARLDHALDQLLEAAKSNSFILTPV